MKNEQPAIETHKKSEDYLAGFTDAMKQKEPPIEVRASNMTLREHFAGLAMQAHVNANLSRHATNPATSFQIAKASVHCAEALIKQLNEPNNAE